MRKIGLDRLPPAVIADDCDPRLAAHLRSRPSSVRLLFGGPDADFHRALTHIFRVQLATSDVIVCYSGGGFQIISSASDHADGLLVLLTPDADGFNVQPSLVCTAARSAGVRGRLRPRRGFAGHAIRAVDSLLFRRVLQAHAGVQ